MRKFKTNIDGKQGVSGRPVRRPQSRPGVGAMDPVARRKPVVKNYRGRKPMSGRK